MKLVMLEFHRRKQKEAKTGEKKYEKKYEKKDEKKDEQEDEDSEDMYEWEESSPLVTRPS